MIRVNIKLFLIVILSFSVSHPEIRYYQSKDLSAVCAIMKSEWSKLSTLPSYDHNMMENMFVKQVPFDPAHQDKKLYVIVYEINNEVVGFATYYYSNVHTGHIELLAIAPSHQAKGLGKQMMEFMQQEFKNHHAKYIQLYVYPSNPKAIEFYKHLGFGVKLRAFQQWLLSKILK